MTDTLDTLAIMGLRTPWVISTADESGLAAYRDLRRRVFVQDQGIFSGDDGDEHDADPATIVLVARDWAGRTLGGVRVAPVGDATVGWWRGSRLVVEPDAAVGVGRALVRAACATVESRGALRFDAAVQPDKERFFLKLGWVSAGTTDVNGHLHVAMRWPVDRFARLVATTKSWLGPLLAGVRPGTPGFVGDDGAPVPGADLVAATDAITPSMVERDPRWAGWCAVLVNVNDLAAMGATPIGMLDALGVRNAAAARLVMEGLTAAADAYGLPLLGGHTQLGVSPSLSVTALGRTNAPVPAGGGRPGDEVRMTADTSGGWRPGYHGRQWDSTTHRTPDELRAMVRWVSSARPAAAKDVSMAGVVGTLGMLAEASGCAAELDVTAIPRPAAVNMADWLTCFPGFGMLTAHRPGAPIPASDPAVSVMCGRLVPGQGVSLVWPDGARVPALEGGVTGLGPA